MARIIIKNLSDREVFTEDSQTSILQAVQNSQVDWMHACGGKGRCTTCKLIVVEGLDNFTPPSNFELKVRRLGALKENERLACQCMALDDVTIKVPEKSKLPHLKYSD